MLDVAVTGDPESERILGVGLAGSGGFDRCRNAEAVCEFANPFDDILGAVINRNGAQFLRPFQQARRRNGNRGCRHRGAEVPVKLSFHGNTRVYDRTAKRSSKLTARLV